MFLVCRLAEFCWKCLAKKALIVGGTAGAVAGGVMLARRYDQKVSDGEQVIETFRVSAPPKKSPPQPPPAPIKGMPVSVEFDDEDEQ